MAGNFRDRGEARRDLEGVGSLPPLVEGKLAVPSLRRGVVDRVRIRQALDGGDDATLTLVVAPAGYGKTTAVRSWCASEDAALAWVTLDAGDNDPVRLWRYVATAVDRARAGLGRGMLRRLGVAGGPVEVAIDELRNEAAGLGSNLLVVLDDIQAVTSEECLSLIDYALAHLPRNVRVVLISRVDPALRLARLRAAGALAEVRGADLAFTVAEAFELLVVHGGLELGGEEIEALVEHTGGWPAALVLAWLWLRSVEDPAQAVRAFGGNHRFVADYLSSEVLASLDEDTRLFLHGIAVLGEFTADLCDGVLDCTDSAVRLAELERSNLFVSGTERGAWFRIHPLFAEYARTQLVSLDPGAPTRIHRRAAEWLRSHGWPSEAVEHAAAAGDHEIVTQLLVEYHLALIRGGAGGTVVRWVRTLPEDRIVDHPELAAAAAAGAMLVGGRTLEQRRWLALADRGIGMRPEQADPYVETDDTTGARGHDRRRRGAGGARRSACGRARGGRRRTRPSPERCRPTRVRCSSPASWTRPRSWGCGRSSIRRSGGPSRAWWSLTRRLRWRLSRTTGSPPHEATPRKPRWRWAGLARAEAGSGRTRPPRWDRC